MKNKTLISNLKITINFYKKTMYCNFSLELQRREDQVSTVYDNFVADTKIIFCYLGAPSKKTFRKFVSNFFRKISTAQKMKFSIKDFFSKCEQILSFLWIWSHLQKISLMVNFIFVQCRFSTLDKP